MNSSSDTAATIPDSRPRPPEFTLISDWPIMAHPPMPPKKPQVMLATPWPTHSRLPRPRVSVMSSIRLMVISDSISPTAARISANGAMIHRVSSVRGGSTKSMKKGLGKPASRLAEAGSIWPITVSSASGVASGLPASRSAAVSARVLFISMSPAVRMTLVLPSGA